MNNYIKEDVFFSRNNKQIFGVIYKPVMIKQPMPTVIYSHGFNGTHENGILYAEFLAENGFVTCVFDFCGGSTQSKSDGSTLEMTISSEILDLETVILEMKSLDYVDPNQLFLIGASQGGVVSAMTASNHSEDINGLVLLCPAFVIPDNARETFSSIAEIPKESHMRGMIVGRDYFAEVFNYDFLEHIKSFNKHVLIIHGDKDTLAPIRYSERALNIYNSAELEVLPDIGHKISGDDNQVREAILNYLKAR
ncbi:alpha/beta hydrolase [Enterococcus sp.]|uniref:alpha/beta hydrolase n=1 Tax=Enterococcus sp. TaxID=35783 RepID=UPI00290F29BA|nr:alpha/beta hydrolase [Enterococcus sp.]MDU5333174.1 alpha/beta hydrolase [Enterococcus sp.]